jgi:DNA-binding transcriptional LysR family regulator
MDNRDFNLYKIFLTLYELKSISKTANKLYVSQPAISYSLKELESQLGYSLFYRNSKGIEPTMEAMELYSYISKAFNIIKNGEDHIKNLNSLNIGTIRIGSHSHIASFYLSSFIADFKKIYPGIKFEIISRQTANMIDMLEKRNLSLIIATLPININNKSVKKINIGKLNNCFAYNKSLLKDCKISSVRDLNNYPLILPSATSNIRARLDEYMEKNGVTLNPSIESWTTEFMLEMVRRGAGVGYFVENVIDTQTDKENFEVITFDGDLPKDELCAVYLGDYETTAMKKFIEYLNDRGVK